MRHATRTWLVIGILTLALGLVGCGDKGGGGVAGGGNGDGGGGSGRIDGADSPAEVIELARPFAEKNDWGSLIGIIAPDDRPAMAFMGLFMAKMMPNMLKMAAEFTPDEAAKKEAQEKYEAMNDAMDAALKKHGVDISKFDAAEGEGLMTAGGDPDPAKVRAWMEKTFPDLDPGAFLTDVFEVAEKYGDANQTEMMSKGFKGKLENLKVDGDRATGTVDGDEVVFRKVNGRWYVSLSEMMGN